MKNTIEYVILSALVTGLLCGCASNIMNVEQESQAVWEVRLAVQKALCTEDTDALMKLCTDDATFGQPNGELWIGKDRIREVHEKLFEMFDDFDIEFKRLAINFPTPDVAVEDVSYVFTATGFQYQGRDTQVLVKRNGRWLITAVSDFIPQTPSKSTTEQTEVNMQDEIEAVHKREDEFLAAHSFNDGAKLADFYTDDALLIPPDEPIVRGKKAIADWYENEFKKAPPIENPKVTLEDIKVCGNTAFIRGDFILKFEGQSTDRLVRQNLRFISIWQRQPDETWKFYCDIWNTNAPLEDM
jgi:uncharacterized protein (TIGR02246 family)